MKKQPSRRLANTRSNTRRRPQQSRARHTANALQEAFVRLWAERDYESITIREIVSLAGTGLGSFYEYFASKKDLAQVALHMRSKTLLLTLKTAAGGQGPAQTLDALLRAIIDALVEIHRERPAEWATHYYLERKLSDASAYAKMYERFVREWARAIEGLTDRACVAVPVAEVARTCQTITYGLVADAHIRRFVNPVAAHDDERLGRQLHLALKGYLLAATEPARPAP